MCPPLCLRGGLGRTLVTWWRGRPCVGSSDRPSHDAERDRGDEYDGTDGGGEELESSHRPDGSEESNEWITEDVSARDQEGRGREMRWGELQGAIISASELFPLKQMESALRWNDSDLTQARL